MACKQQEIETNKRLKPDLKKIKIKNKNCLFNNLNITEETQSHTDFENEKTITW